MYSPVGEGCDCNLQNGVDGVVSVDPERVAVSTLVTTYTTKDTFSYAFRRFGRRG